MAQLWLGALTVSTSSMLFGLQIATTGNVPGANDGDSSLKGMLIAVGLGIAGIVETGIAGRAHDAQRLGENTPT